MLDPSHESALQSHFRELFVIYLEALAKVETDPASRLEQICEPLFYQRLKQGWQDLKESGATEITILNHAAPQDLNFDLSLVSFSNHINGYLDRIVDIRSKNTLRQFNGVEYRYAARWPYKNHIETSTRFLVRVETDLKLNLTVDGRSLIDENDDEAVRSKEVHFIMLEGRTDRHNMGLFGFLKMLKSALSNKSILPEDGVWQVADFDFFMRGNPHDLAGMRDAYGSVPKTPSLKEHEKQPKSRDI